MKQPILIILTFFAVLQACNNPSTKPEEMKSNDSTTFGKMLHEYNEERLMLFPLEATVNGDNRYNDKLPNIITVEFRSKLKGFYTEYKSKLEGFDRSQLNSTDQISYDLFKWECDISLEDLTFPKNLMPINQFESLNLNIGQYAGGTSAQPFKTVKDYENWLARLTAFTEWCDTAIANMRIGMKSGYVLPKPLAIKVIPQMETLSKGPAENHLFYTPIKSMPENFSADDKATLTKAYAEMVNTKIIPAFKNLYTFFKDEYLPACRETHGISAIPNGAAYYDHQIKMFTTTTMTADEIFKLGESEVKRLSGEMEKVKEQVGFKGDLKAFFNHVRTKKELIPFTDPKQVIDNFNKIHAEMQPSLEKLFDMVPKTGFEVRRTEAFREASASAEYLPGAKDGSRPGIFYVPIPNVKEYNFFSDEDLFLHEAIPGHHYQISLQQENKDLPEFRQTGWYNAYGEGWALYSESLGKELGLYKDPYQYFGMLSAEMHRAIRLVVDAGIHTKGWTREQAIQYSLDHEAESEASIVSEIERYMSWPGQALSYKIGQLKIIELRTKAEKELGDKFDIKEFHNQVLDPGCIPLAVLENKINTWIEKKKSTKTGS